MTLKNNATGESFDLAIVELVMKIFCIFQEGKLRSEIPGVSGLGRMYELLPIKPEKEIRDMMRALVNQYEYSQSVAESRHAAKYKDLLGEEYISVMDALDAAFLTTFTKAEREEFGTRDNPALQFYQAMKKDKNELLSGCLVKKKDVWPGKMFDYALVWLGRNQYALEDRFGMNKETLFMLKKSCWSVLLDCSSRYEKEINERLMNRDVE